MTQDLKVVSLFDGISCGREALERTGYAVSYYAAYEIDKYARAISRYQYPDIEHHGDVMDAGFTRFSDIDLIIGGSPCQKFSIARSKGREIEKGGSGWELFMKYVEAVRTIKPAYFLYENVASMHKNMRQYITEELGCEPVMINSALMSAQQRKRLYWTNIKGVTQPEDRGVLLQDILESGLSFTDKSYCITATYAGATFQQTIQKKKRTTIAEPIALADKSQTILSTHKEKALSMVKCQKTGLFVTHEITGTDIEANVLGAALRTRTDENGSFKRLEAGGDDKLDSLTTILSDSVICTSARFPSENVSSASCPDFFPAQPVRVGTIGNGGQGERIYSVRGKTVSLPANGGGGGAKTGLYKIDLPDGDYTVRKLTVTEAERCQTLNDGYTALGIDDNGKLINISNTQRYKAIGNGWTVDIIAHILSFMEV